MNEEDRARANRLLETVDGIGSKLDSLGTKSGESSDASGASVTHELRLGDLSFIFRISNGWSHLNWDSNLPDYLIPGRGALGSQEFMDFLLYELPEKLYGIRRNFDHDKMYKPFSSLIVDYDPRIIAGPHRKVARLSSETDLYEFQRDFMDRPRSIRKILALVSPGLTQVKRESFLLNIEYPTDNNPIGKLSIGLPLADPAISAWGNEGLARWALETHKDSPPIDAELGIAAKAMSLTLLGKAEEALRIQQF